MDNAPAVKCPVHGEHGRLKYGKCWDCEISGQQPVGYSTSQSSQPSSAGPAQNKVVLAYKEQK